MLEICALSDGLPIRYKVNIKLFVSVLIIGIRILVSATLQFLTQPAEISYVQNHFGFTLIALHSDVSGCVCKNTFDVMGAIRTLQLSFGH